MCFCEFLLSRKGSHSMVESSRAYSQRCRSSIESNRLRSLVRISLSYQVPSYPRIELFSGEEAPQIRLGTLSDFTAELSGGRRDGAKCLCLFLYRFGVRIFWLQTAAARRKRTLTDLESFADPASCTDRWHCQRSVSTHRVNSDHPATSIRHTTVPSSAGLA